MAFTSTDLSNVEDAIIALATGQRAVQVVIGGKSITYSSAKLSELRRLRDLIRSELEASAGPFNKVRFDAPV